MEYVLYIMMIFHEIFMNLLAAIVWLNTNRNILNVIDYVKIPAA